MATYPAAIFSKNTASEGQTLDQFGHTQNHNDVQDEIIAIQTKLGVDGSAVANAIDWILNQGYRRETGSVSYGSATTIVITGVDKTAIYKQGTRIRLNAAGTPVYVTVSGSVFSTDTTITVYESTVPNPVNTLDYEVNPRGYEQIPWAKIATLDKCRLRRSADQTIANNTVTAVQFTTEDYDTNTMHDNATNNTRVTIKKTGYYLLTHQVYFQLNATGERESWVRKNGGGARYAWIRQTSASSSLNSVLSGSDGPILLSAGDYVELVVYQDSGGNLNVDEESTLETPTLTVTQVL